MAFGSPPPRPTAEQKAERLRVQQVDGAAARAEYEATVAHEGDKIARLRALRKERDEAEAAATAKPAPKARTTVKKQRRNIPVG